MPPLRVDPAMSRSDLAAATPQGSSIRQRQDRNLDDLGRHRALAHGLIEPL